MATDMMPRTPGQAPGRAIPPGRPVPPGHPVPPGRPVPPRRPGAPGGAVLPGRDMPPQVKSPQSPKAPKSPKKPRNPRTRLFTAPRHTRPLREPGAPPVTNPVTKPVTNPVTKPVTKPVTRTATGQAAGQGTRLRRPRAPFILLLVGLLGGALISLLVISTTLAEGSFAITSLQQQDTNLARQEQVLAEQVAQASSPAQIAQEAEHLGMQQDPNLQFIDLKTGKIVSGRVSRADAEIDVPGFTP